MIHMEIKNRCSTDRIIEVVIYAKILTSTDLQKFSPSPCARQSILLCTCLTTFSVLMEMAIVTIQSFATTYQIMLCLDIDFTPHTCLSIVPTQCIMQADHIIEVVIYAT